MRGSLISVLGPIPLPLAFCETRVDVDWYACVRNTELGKIEELADDLREQNGQQSFATLASFMAVNSVLVIGESRGMDEAAGSRAFELPYRRCVWIGALRMRAANAFSDRTYPGR